MGSWNKTCGLTQMPIFSGEEAICFYLIENPFPTDAMTSYTSGYWSYIPLPFYGQYDDYGFLDMNEGEDWKLSCLKEAYGNAVVINEPENSVDNWLVDKNVFNDYEKFKDAIHRDRLHLSLYHLKDSCVSFIMFEKKTFDTLKQVHKPEQFINILREYKEYISDESNIKIPEHYKDIVKDTMTKELVLSMIGYDDCISEFCEKKKINKWNDHRRSFLRFWFSRDLSLSDSGGFGSSNIIRILRQTKNVPDEVFVDAYLAEVILFQLRKQWIPAGHEGSQEELNPDHKAFLKAYKNRMNTIKHRWDEYDN